MDLSFQNLVIESFRSIDHLELDLSAVPAGLHFFRGINKKAPRLASNGCLAGGTMIDCPRDLVKYPKGIPIRELVGKKFWTYSWSSKYDEMVLSKVRDVWCSGTRSVYRVEVSGYPTRNMVGVRGGGTRVGKFLPPCELVGTFDHPVMLCDGTWKKLGELQVGDSIKSFYRQDNDRGLLRWSFNVLNHRVLSPPEFVGREKVYDLEVPHTNNFIANGMVVHNSGKSTVFDALTWIPFGKTVRGLRAPDVVPWGKRRGEPSGTLEMLIDGKPRVMQRVNNALTIDGKEAGPEHVTELLGLNYDLFVNTVVLGQGQPLFFDLPPRAKLQLFTDVLALERWEARSAYAGKEVIAGEQELAGIRGRLDGVKANLKQTEELVKSARGSLDNWEADRQAQLAVLAKDLEKLAETYKHAQGRADAATLLYDGAGLQLKLLRESDVKLRDALGRAKGNLTVHNAEVRGLESKLAEMVRDAEAFGTAENCPVCGQPIAGTDFERHKNNLERSIGKQRKVIKEAKAVDRFDNVVKLLEKDLQDNRQHLVKFEAAVDKARATLDLALPQAADAKSKLTFMQGKSDEWEAQTNPYREQLTKLRRQQAKLEKEVETLTKEADAWERRNVHTKFWVKGFKDVRLYIIDEVLQELELTTNAMLEEVGLLGWSVQYDIEKETKSGTIQRGLNVSIVSPESRVPAKWEAWSGGEGQRLRLVGALALSDVLLNSAGVNTDLEILDEPTRHLSGTGVRDLCEWLAVRSKQLARRTLLVDHYAVDATYFSSTFTVIKDEHGSHMENLT